MTPEQAWADIMHTGLCWKCDKRGQWARVWFRVLEPAWWGHACRAHRTELVLAV
jgi:hypothetical protein